MKDIAIICAGGFGREVKMLIDQINEVEKKYNLLGYYDDDLAPSTIVNGYPILGEIEALNNVSTELSTVVAIALPALKRKVLSKINNPLIVHPTLIHPNVIIGKDEVSIGEGCIICAGNIITVSIEIGRHVIFNLGCTVGHNTTIGDYCSFMPSVNVSGEVTVYKDVFVGTGAQIIDHLQIGEGTIIGAGAVVYKSLPAHCTAVGIPARPVKFHNSP
jgi:sugar O-acyltransferase (sialic acid O-acetyltransferase NeuD family)